MIRASSRSGYRWQEAEALLQKASEAKLVADTQLMNAVLAACAKAGQHSALHKFKGLRPTAGQANLESRRDN